MGSNPTVTADRRQRDLHGARVDPSFAWHSIVERDSGEAKDEPESGRDDRDAGLARDAEPQTAPRRNWLVPGLTVPFVEAEALEERTPCSYDQDVGPARLGVQSR